MSSIYNVLSSTLDLLLKEYWSCSTLDNGCILNSFHGQDAGRGSKGENGAKSKTLWKWNKQKWLCIRSKQPIKPNCSIMKRRHRLPRPSSRNWRMRSKLQRMDPDIMTAWKDRAKRNIDECSMGWWTQWSRQGWRKYYYHPRGVVRRLLCFGRISPWSRLTLIERQDDDQLRTQL